jgi:serine/threonine-protein kinase
MSDIPHRFAAALADRYVLEREIGAGGMATVYLARDLRHKRSVALKVVRPELGGREGVERFLREIELAARLQHPHVLPVFDSGVMDDGTGASVPYFVMPYVEGETLRQRLQRERRLSVEVATTLAAEVADALGYAHAQGVVHRDIKPENILLSGGHAVVADFGVAKALESGIVPQAGSASTRLTRAGIAVGTPLYMSPEQATGDELVGPPADQYSLACVLYEMLTGEPPFTGSSHQAVIARSLSAPRPRASRVRPEVPPELEEVVTRALALEPGDRFPDMASFGRALRGTHAAPARGGRRRFYVAAGIALLVSGAAGAWFASRTDRTVASAAESLAVLPFRTSGPGVEFLGEGMVDLLSTNLSGVGGIYTVDPRTVVRRWGRSSEQGSDISRALAVGRSLDAGSVVLGSVVSTGGRVRLAADLYSTEGKPLGRAQVDASTDSVLGAVDRLSLALLRDVWRSKEPIPNLRLASLTTDSIDALRSYLQGERYYRRLAWDSALSAYTRAVESDSTFALAHLRRAQVFGWTGGYGNKESHEAVAAGVRFSNRLPARDRRLLLGYRLFDQGKPAAIDSLQAFVTMHPDDVEGWYLLGEAMFHTQSFRPAPPESIAAVFDSVLRRDSTLYPALIHPTELAVSYRDSAQFARYFPTIERNAPAARVSALKTTAKLVWGPSTTVEDLRAVLATEPSWVIHATSSSYHRHEVTSDSIVQLFARIQRAGPRSADFLANALGARAHVLAGLGRWREARAIADSLGAYDPEEAVGVQAWSIALGLAPASLVGFIDSAVSALPPGPEAEHGRAMVELFRGRVAEGRRRIARTLGTRDSRPIPDEIRGLLIAADGWGSLMQGDSTRGLERFRSGIELAAAPDRADDTAFLRFQLAVALAARPQTRSEAIRWMKYAFHFQPLYLPLIQLALGRTYEAAGQRDSAAVAYGRFIRLWDKADPELQGRVEEARQSLRELTKERP